MLRKLATGLVLAAALIAVYLIILFGSALVPGSPMNEAWKRAETMADDPTDAQIKTWFEGGSRLDLRRNRSPRDRRFVGWSASAARFSVEHSRLGTGVLSWFTFYFVFVGTGAREIVVSVVSLVLFGMFEYIAQKRVASAIAA